MLILEPVLCVYPAKELALCRENCFQSSINSFLVYNRLHQGLGSQRRKKNHMTDLLLYIGVLSDSSIKELRWDLHSGLPVCLQRSLHLILWWPAHTNFLSGNYNLQHIQTKINFFFNVKFYFHDLKIIKLYNFPQTALSYGIFCQLYYSQNKVLWDWKEVQITSNWKWLAGNQTLSGIFTFLTRDSFI